MEGPDLYEWGLELPDNAFVQTEKVSPGDNQERPDNCEVVSENQF